MSPTAPIPAPGTPPTDVESGLKARLRRWAKSLRREGRAVFLAMKDPRTPWPARLLGFLTCAYAFSPIDLIPDFIPIIGYLDDLLLVPCGIWLTWRLIPPALQAEFRARADEMDGKPFFAYGLPVVILTWLLVLVAGFWIFWSWATV